MRLMYDTKWSKTGAPTSNAEMFTLWYERIRAMVRRFGGVHPADVEDVTMDLFERFIKLDLVGNYDEATAKFSTLITKTATVYMRGFADVHRRRYRREPIVGSWHTLIGTSDDDNADTTVWAGWLDQAAIEAGPEDLVCDRFDADRAIDELRSELASLPGTAVQRAKMVETFDAMMDSIRRYGEIVVDDGFKYRLQVGHSAAYSRTREVRGWLCVMYGRETRIRRRNGKSKMDAKLQRIRNALSVTDVPASR